MMKQLKYLSFLIVFVIAAILFLSNKTIENEKEPLSIIGVRVMDIDGKTLRIGMKNQKAKPTSLVFMDVDCPISKRFMPKLNKLAKEAEQQGVAFYGIISNPYVSWKAAKDFQKEYKIDFPIIFDSNGDLAYRLQPTVVPEAFVLDVFDNIVYYGRINDQYIAPGKLNKNVRSEDLEKAITAAANGKQLMNKHQKSIGCVFEPWKMDKLKLNYNRHISPLIEANCTPCHQPNAVAPFSLLTYEDAVQRGHMIQYVTEERFMPIWKGKPGFGKFLNEHYLSDHQIEVLKQWVENGMEEGDVADYIPRVRQQKRIWEMGEPDLILKMEPYQLPAEGDDQYRVFVIKDAIPKGKVLKGYEFKAGDPSVVHHSTIFIDYSKKLRQYDAEDPLPGYDAFEKGGTMEFGSAITIGNWAPGMNAYQYPEGVGFYVPEASDIAFENHYHLSGKETVDESYIGLYFMDSYPQNYASGAIIGSQKLHIPAGEANYEAEIWSYVPIDIILTDIGPHMHYIGQEAKLTVELPNGKVQPLLHISEWDLRWQSVYRLREPMEIPKGSIIKGKFTYDNSDDNYSNPYYPAQDMFWGWGSNDEMLEFYLTYYPKNADDYGKMTQAGFAAFLHDYSSKERIKVTESNLSRIFEQFRKTDIWSKEGEKLLISVLESGYSEQLASQFKKASKNYKNDANFNTNYASLMLWSAFFSFDGNRIVTDGGKAANLLEKVLRQDENNWNAGMQLSKLLLDSGTPEYEKDGAEMLTALIEHQETLTKQEKFSNAYFELGRYYYKLRKDKEAATILKRGLELFPDNRDLKQELASEGRIVKKILNQK